MKFIPCLLSGLILFISGVNAGAASLELTASFSPSMENPENNIFSNTTPISGYCSQYPSQCSDTFSINIPLSTTLSVPQLLPGSADRDAIYIKMPGAWREFTVKREGSSEEKSVNFRISNFSATYRTVNDWTLAIHNSSWTTNSFVSAPSPCKTSGVGAYMPTYYLFMWTWPISDSACIKKPAVTLTGEPNIFNDMSIGYELVTPEPLKMESGTYKGTLRLSVGPGGDIDFGDSYQASDTVLDINVTLSVNHEFKLMPATDGQNITLQPCSSGNICSQEQGKANWERWMITRITPELTGKSHFSLSSSGSFTTYLQCEYQIEDNCALKSDNSAQLAPVETLLTLSENIVDSATGNPVTRKRLKPGKDKNIIFETRTFGQNKPGIIDFLVKQRDVDTMLTTRPDTYRGAVTVIFDAAVY